MKNSTKQNVIVLKGHIKKCPDEIKIKHPYALLILAMHMMLHNEFELMQGIASFNNLEMMNDHFQKAWELLGTSTAVFENNSDMTQGSPSILYLYYRESGKLKTDLEMFKEGYPNYKQLTKNQGHGSDCLMESEWYYNQGDFVNAEIALNSTLHLARADDQWSVAISVLFLQVRIDFMKQDFDHMFRLLNQIRQEIVVREEYQYLHKVELCEIWFYAQLDQKLKISDDLGSPDTGEIQRLYANYGMFYIILK